MMMKKILVMLLFISVLISTLSTGFSAFADEDPEKGHYLWTFDNEALNDTENGIYTANTGNNRLTLQNVTDPVFSQQAIAAGLGVTAKIDKPTAAHNGADLSGKLGNALWVAGVWFQMEKSFTLKHDAAWYISLTGRLPNGYNGSNSLPNPDGALFAGETDEFFLSGNRCAFLFTKTVAEEETEYKMYNPNWQDSYRIGQALVNTLNIWNEYNTETSKWEIHWIVTERHDAGNKGWEGVEYTCNTPSVDFTFSSLGSATNYFGTNWWGSPGIAYFTRLEIIEDLNTFQPQKISSVPEGIISDPVSGVAFSRKLNLGADLIDVVNGSVRWTDANTGAQKNKATPGGTYTVTITLIPVVGYAFDGSTVIPTGFAHTLNADGSLTLTKTYMIPAEEEITPIPSSTEEPATSSTEEPTTTAPKESEGGCGSTISVGSGWILLAGLFVGLFTKKKCEEN